MSVSDPQNPDPKDEEPARRIGVIMAAVPAVLALIVAFGANLTPDQTAAILGAAGAIGALVQAFWTRRNVFSPATVARLLRGRDG